MKGIEGKDIAIAVRLLRGARERIAACREDYVCHALMRAERYTGTGVGFKLREEISRRLGPHSTVATWLKSRRCKDVTAQNLREYRLRWIDSMIKELVEKRRGQATHRKGTRRV